MSSEIDDRGRLLALEARGQHYEAEFERLNASVIGLDRKMEAGFERLSMQIREQAAAGRITWPLILAGVMAFLGVLAAAGAFHTQSLAPLDMRIRENREAAVRHADGGGHPEMQVAAARLEARVDALEARVAGGRDGRREEAARCE